MNPGSSLGHYRVVSKLGEGGMGEVYRAIDTKLHRDVAIKVLPGALTDDGERLARFTREAQTLAALNHPNIAHIHGLEESGGVRALVMELVEGEDLADRLARGAIPVDESIAIAKQVANGLEAAHDKGIVHRDLKPANIKVTPEGVVKILDFGLAKAVAAETDASALRDSGQGLADSPTITSPAHTRAGMILGTAAYMAPEQARGKPVDRRADIWAFGVVLFEMLSGRRLFAGETVSDVLAAVLTRSPDWQALPAGTPASVRRLLARCLESDPRRRLRDIGDARWDLDATPEATASLAPAHEPRRLRQALPWAIAALATLVAGGMAVLRPDQAASPSRTFHLDVMLPPGVEPGGNLNLGMAISPDGRTAAMVGIRGGVRRVFLRQLDSSDTTELPDFAGVNGAGFSPDGTSLGILLSSGAIELVTLADRQRKVLVRGGADVAGSIASFAWSASDVVFGRSTALWKLSSAGGSPQPLTTLDTARGEVLHTDAVALPVGRTILFVSLTTEPGAERIEAVDLDSGRRSVVVERASSPVLSPTGHLLFARDGALLAAPFDPATATIRGTPIPVLRAGAVEPRAAGGLRLKLSAAGTLLYEPAAFAARRVLSVGRDGAAKALDLPPGDYGFPRVSVDGTRLLVTVAESTLEAFDLARGTRARLAAAAWGTSFPSWTADASRVVVRRFGLPTSMMADGSGEPTRVPSLGTPDYPSGPGHDADSVVVSSVRPETSGDVYLVSLSGAFEPKPLVVTRAYEGGAHLSPDGRWLLYQSNESGQMEAYVRPYPALDRRWQVSEGGGLQARWSRNGAEIYYRSNGKFMAVAMQSTGAAPVFAKPVALFADEYAFGLGITAANYDVTPDGRFMLVGFNSRGAALRAVINWTEELKKIIADGGVK